MSADDKLACNQVTALLPYYIEGRVSNQIKFFIESHLNSCKSCREKYEALQKIRDTFDEAKKSIKNVDIQKEVPISSYSTSFREKMSAYLDNELDDEESLRFKKYAIANPPVRNELEGMYKIKNALNSSFEKTKNDLKEDFTKDIIVELNILEDVYAKENVLKVASIFIFLFVFLTVGVIVIF